MVTMLKPRLGTFSTNRTTTLVSATARTRGRPWQRIRERIMRRDNGLCQVCKRAGILKLAAYVDHIHELADGGDDNDANLQAICFPCHEEKTAASQAKRAGR